MMIGKVIKMTSNRKSTIEGTKDNQGGNNKMVIVLDKNRAGSQKKQEFMQQ